MPHTSKSTGTLSLAFSIVILSGILHSPSNAQDQSEEPPGAQSETRQQSLRRSPDATRPGMSYWIHEPRSAKPDQPLPLMLFLHGGGEGGDDPELVKKHGPPKRIEAGADYPCMVVSPQNPSTRQYWDDQQLIELLDHVCETQNIDPNRIYLTGMSRGCYGGWRLLIQNPDRFAAFVGVCGGGPAPYAKRVAQVPIRLFHGMDDNVIPSQESKRMYEAHLKAGGDCQLTLYPGTGHDAWTVTYDNANLLHWMLKQKRKSD